MGRGEGGSRERGHVQLWLIRTVVQQKLTQHCEAIFLQLKNKLKKKNLKNTKVKAQRGEGAQTTQLGPAGTRTRL